MVSCLLIDGNAAERSRIGDLVRGFGMDCVERAGAAEGIRYCDEQQPEVVLMDATARPEVDEFLRRVRRQAKGRKMPVVILYSEAPDMASMGQSIIEGAAEFMVKPFDGRLLSFKLEQAGLLKH
jgi:two-component system chemotaxis response regulator CheY